jgi:hypothetical protein
MGGIVTRFLIEEGSSPSASGSPLPELATSADVVARLGRALTTVEAARIDALLTDASASVRNYTRQTITEETTTDRLRVRGGKVRLPQRPVTAVTSVTNMNGDPVLYQWFGFDDLWTSPNVPDTWAWEPWRTGIMAVDVTYTHGYDPVPDDIVGVVCSIVMRAIGREPVDAGITTESIQGYSYTLGSAAAAGGFGMLQAERDILDAYRRVASTPANMMPQVII